MNADVTGTCTPPGTTGSSFMTESACRGISGCNDWHIGADRPPPAGAVEWTPVCAPASRATGDASAEVFAKLGQVLAATYAKRMTAEAACHEVIRQLSQLITEASNHHPASDNGHCRSKCSSG